MLTEIRNSGAPMRSTHLALCALGLSLAAFGGARAEENVSPEADFTVREITQALFKAKPGEKLNYSGHDLTYLDLSGLDFKQATLSRADLYGVDFTGANLKGTDLSYTRLDRAVLIRADLSGANLKGTTIYRPTVYSDLHVNLADAPHFAGADLTDIRVQAELSGSDFRGANLTHANFSPLEARPGQGTLTTLTRNVLKSCDFSGATLKDANFTRAVLTFSRMVGADLTGASFLEADLSKVDFSGATLAGVDFTGADLDGANLASAQGLDSAKGLDKAINLDKAFR